MIIGKRRWGGGIEALQRLRVESRCPSLWQKRATKAILVLPPIRIFLGIIIVRLSLVCLKGLKLYASVALEILVKCCCMYRVWKRLGCKKCRDVKEGYSNIRTRRWKIKQRATNRLLSMSLAFSSHFQFRYREFDPMPELLN